MENTNYTALFHVLLFVLFLFIVATHSKKDEE